MAKKKIDKKLRQWRVREELKLHILKLIHSFKSQEEPTYKNLTDEDVINVLTSIVAKKTS